MADVKALIKGTPIIGPLASRIWNRFQVLRFAGANAYWERRYATGGNSGDGSYGHLAHYKADVVNSFVLANNVGSVIELGSGDGHQLSLAQYPSYIGLDVSRTAIQMCRDRFRGDATKRFFLYNGECCDDKRNPLAADLAMSLDVIFHLTETAEYERYMRNLFAVARRFVIVYASNWDERPSPHMRHHHFTEWIEKHKPEWGLAERRKNSYPDHSVSDFYFFTKGL